MIIEVRPTPVRRLQRARIIGLVAGLALLTAVLVSAAQLVGAAEVSQRDTVWPSTPSADRHSPVA